MTLTVKCAQKGSDFYVLPGEPGVPGQRGTAGPEGPKGIQGESGNVGVTYIRWGKKTCPNTGATLVYEGKNTTVGILSQRVFYRYL